MPGVLIEKQQLSLPDGYPVFPDDICHGSPAHIYDLHIIVAVHGKPDKPCMRTNRNQLPVVQHPRAVHRKFLAGGVKLFFYTPFSIQNSLLFFRNDANL